METATHTVLFVCTGNYYRSRYAEYCFNARVPATLGWHADSRGFEPSPHNPGPINAAAAARLAERGEAPANFRTPAQLTEQDLNQADLIIMLDDNEHRPYVQQRYPTWEDQVVYWRIADLWAGLTAEQALSRIDSMVDQLIAELRSQA